jgi:hypothetical protein
MQKVFKKNHCSDQEEPRREKENSGTLQMHAISKRLFAIEKCNVFCKVIRRIGEFYVHANPRGSSLYTLEQSRAKSLYTLALPITSSLCALAHSIAMHPLFYTSLTCPKFLQSYYCSS